MHEKDFVTQAVSILRNPGVKPGDEIQPVAPDNEVRPDMTVEERLALLSAEPVSRSSQRTELPANQDPFNLLSIDRITPIELYRKEATDLFDACDDTFALFASITPVHRDRIGKKSRRSTWQDLPSVQLGDFSYFMRRTVAPTNNDVSYNFLRGEKAYEDSGFTLSKNKNGVMLIRRAGWEGTDNEDDATYGKLLFTAERWIKDYAMFVPKPVIRTEVKHSMEIPTSRFEAARYNPYGRYYRFIRRLAVIAITPTILVNGMDLVGEMAGQAGMNQPQHDTVNAGLDSKSAPAPITPTFIGFGSFLPIFRAVHNVIAPFAIAEVAPHVFDPPQAQKP